MEKPSLPKGTRDFGPAEMGKRQFILETIRKVFQKFGFQSLETPAMENLSTLTGKYGEEGDQLLFRILNNGDFLLDADPALLQSKDSKKVASSISGKGLRYDLTVPFARFVVMNRSELTMPFRRFQIQPVWRADRPQKGRYREFFQCDADVVGTDSLVCEAEIVLMIKEIFGALGITGYAIKMNHRAVLNGFAEVIGAQGKEQDLFIAIDKLGKAGEQVVKDELKSKGFSDSAVQSVFEILQWKGSNPEKQKSLNSRLSGSATGKKGTDEIEEIFRFLHASGDDGSHVELDISLARGLSYYTGAIFEVKINNVAIGSVCGGGRYDNLTQAFGSKEKLSGVGISFGIDRIYDAMEELKIFPKETVVSTTALVAHADEAGFQHGLKVTAAIRAGGIAAEIYPEPSKLKKQLEYADKKNIPFVIVIGSEEITTGTLTLKNMESGDQQKLSLEKIIDQLVLKK